MAILPCRNQRVPTMTARTLSLSAGLLLLVIPVLLPAPEAIPEAGWRASGLALAMVLWWLTEPVPLAATALLPLAVAPLAGIAPLETVARPFSEPIVFLFLGGFLLAKAIEKSGLHERLAYSLLGIAGQNPARVLAAIMGTTAFLSLWISNTASAMVVAPVAAAIAGAQSGTRAFSTALMLGVAYGATIGGMGSLIGTPPNAIFASFVGQTYGIEIGFARWAAIGVPVALVLLVVTWGSLVVFSPGLRGAEIKAGSDRARPPMSTAEKRVALVAGLTAGAWLTRPLIEIVFPGLALSDAGIAIAAALVLFMLPSGDGGRLLDWPTAATLRWDVLILFGGGLALATILETSGLAAWLAGTVDAFSALPILLLLGLIAAMIVYVGELASNTAMAAIFLPIAGAIAMSLGAEPVPFMLPLAFAASVGFMLPVATPPNAIVFSHETVTRGNMLRAGAPLDVIGIVVAVGLGYLMAPIVFG